MVSFDLKRLFRVPTPAQRLAGLGLRSDLYRAALAMVSDERSDPEIAELERHFGESETVLVVIEGEHGRRLGFLALTSARVIFRWHGARPGDATCLGLSDISEVQDRARGMTGRVGIRATDSVLEVDKILGVQAAQFAQALRRRLADPGAAVTPDPVQELLDLRARRAEGTISRSDFEAAKARLLDEL